MGSIDRCRWFGHIDHGVAQSFSGVRDTAMGTLSVCVSRLSLRRCLLCQVIKEAQRPSGVRVTGHRIQLLPRLRSPNRQIHPVRSDRAQGRDQHVRLCWRRSSPAYRPVGVDGCPVRSSAERVVDESAPIFQISLPQWVRISLGSL